MPNPKRLRIDHQLHVNGYAEEILVECPNCGRCARARGPGWDPSKRHYKVSMICLQCSRQHNFVVTSWDYWNSLPLWLRTTCCGEALWALNSRHLMALEAYVAAGLRENRLGHHTNRHMYMSLPRWITSRKNRSDVLRGLEKLRAMLTRKAR